MKLFARGMVGGLALLGAASGCGSSAGHPAGGIGTEKPESRLQAPWTCDELETHLAGQWSFSPVSLMQPPLPVTTGLVEVKHGPTIEGVNADCQVRISEFYKEINGAKVYLDTTFYLTATGELIDSVKKALWGVTSGGLSGGLLSYVEQQRDQPANKISWDYDFTVADKIYVTYSMETVSGHPESKTHFDYGTRIR